MQLKQRRFRKKRERANSIIPCLFRDISWNFPLEKQLRLFLKSAFKVFVGTV
jgi:hypothetical protein